MTVVDRYAPWDPTREHEPVWSVAQLDEGGTPHQHVIRCACGESFASDVEDSVALYAGHITKLGAPDYLQTYWEQWADHVEGPLGALSRDAVARELSDYSVVMGEASKVYSELANLSKPNTAAHHILAAAEERANEEHADLILHDLLDQIAGEENRQAVIDYANDLSDGAYERHLQGLEMVAKLAARRGGADA